MIKKNNKTRINHGLLTAYKPDPRSPILKYIYAIIFLMFLLISCTRQPSQHDNILIAVSIPPQAWFVSQIAGDKAQTLILVPPGQNPHNYEPTPRQIQSLSGADAWILSGSEFEIILRPKIESLFPDLLIVDGTQGVNFRLLEDHDHYNENNEDTSFLVSHSSFEIDRHTWLGYQNAIILANHILQTFLLLDKANEEYYINRFADIYQEISLVFIKLKNDLALLDGKSIFVYHPSFGYFFDDFGIVQEAVETGGKEPTPRQLNDLILKMTEEKPAAIFVQAQFPVNAARTIADAAGVQVIELDPLAENWLENIIYMGQTLKKLIQ